MEKTILLVDDEAIIREMLGRAISRSGMKVYTAASGQEAIELYKKHKPACVLLDVKLPDIYGPEVLEKLKEIDPQAKVYFVTGVSDEDYRLQEKAKELGAAGYVGKPIIVDELLELLKKV